MRLRFSQPDGVLVTSGLLAPLPATVLLNSTASIQLGRGLARLVSCCSDIEIAKLHSSLFEMRFSLQCGKKYRTALKETWLN